MDTYRKIVEQFEKHPEVLYGFSDISFSDYRGKYAGALVFAVPHAKALTLAAYDEEIFRSFIAEARKKASAIQKEVEAILIEEDSAYEIPPASQSSEDALIVPLSFKFAAVNAGLGWIGKNGVLVTEKYGPMVRLSALLISFEFPAGSPILTSSCPEECFDCVAACPHNALTGKQWNINTQRSEIIDYQLCNQKRSLYKKSHNRKHECGFCMVACRYGLC